MITGLFDFGITLLRPSFCFGEAENRYVLQEISQSPCYNTNIPSSLVDMIHPTNTVLPREVITYIIANVDSRSTLTNLALCSHNFYAISVPKLYNHIELYEGPNDWGSYGTRHLRSLTSLLLRRPDLARFVRHFTFRKTINDGFESRHADQHGRRPKTVEVDDIFKEAIKRLSCSTEEETQWLNHVSWIDHEDAVATLLLPTLVQLERLDLKLMDNETYLARMIDRVCRKQKPFDAQPVFQALTAIIYTGCDYEWGMHPTHIGQFLRLPHICAIIGFSMGTEEWYVDADRALKTLPLRSSVVTHIDLKECGMDMPDIIDMLGVPIALKTFIYELAVIYISWNDVSFKALRDAVGLQEHSLEHISLDYEHKNGVHFSDGSEVNPMRSFASFAKLKSLRIATVFIFGWEYPVGLDQECQNKTPYLQLAQVLPSTIEILHFSHCEDHFSHLLLALEELLLQSSVYVPKLNGIILEGSADVKKWSGSDIASLARMAETQGISLVTLDSKADTSHRDSVERGWGTDASIRWAVDLR